MAKIKQKKPIYKKWWFWVIVVMVIGIVGSSGEDEPVDNQPVDNQAEAQEQGKDTEKTTEKKTEKETETEEETEAVYVIGDIFNVGKLGVKILEVEEKKEFVSDNMFIDDITTDGKFIAVTAELTNNDKEAVTFTNSLFKLIDDQDREFEAHTDAGLMTILGDSYLFLESCNPGMSKTGIFVFEVPADVEQYHLLVREKMFGGEKGTVKLK